MRRVTQPIRRRQIPFLRLEDSSRALLFALCVLSAAQVSSAAVRSGGSFTILADTVSSGGLPLQGGNLIVDPCHVGWLPAGKPAGGSLTVHDGFVPLIIPFPGIHEEPPVPIIAVSANPAECGQTLTFDGTGSTAAPGRAIVSHSWDFGDGSTASGPIVTHAFSHRGTKTLMLTVTDDSSPPLSSTASMDIEIVDTTAPAVTCPPEAVVACGEPIDPSRTGFATASDGCGGAVMLSFADQSVTTDACPRIIRRTWTATDASSHSSQCEQLIVAYDPAGAFITGAGSFLSPVGAYLPSPQLKGVARFAFSPKYAGKGADVPTGETRLMLQFAGITFVADACDWLVVTGAWAQFKGVGKINGRGDYGLLVTAVDAALIRRGQKDTLRFKIWNRATGELVYDNQLGAADDANPETAISAGQIVIHERGKSKGKAAFPFISARAPRIQDVWLDSQRLIRVAAMGEPFQVYAIQESSDLRQWEHLDFILSDGDGQCVYGLPVANSPAAFYRLILTDPAPLVPAD